MFSIQFSQEAGENHSNRQFIAGIGNPASLRERTDKHLTPELKPTCYFQFDCDTRSVLRSVLKKEPKSVFVTKMKRGTFFNRTDITYTNFITFVPQFGFYGTQVPEIKRESCVIHEQCPLL